MIPVSPPDEQLEIHLMLFIPQLRKVLTTSHDGYLRLPTIHVPREHRICESVTAAVLNIWGIISVVIELLSGGGSPRTIALLEVCSGNLDFRAAGLTPIEPSSLDNRDLNEADSGFVQAIISERGGGRGPLARFGWLKTAQDWIRDATHHPDIEFTSRIRQLGCSPFASVVRIESVTSEAWWLKASANIDPYEFDITSILTRICPDRLPKILSARRDWNAWITESFGGPINQNCSLFAFEQCVESLAHIQIASSRHLEEFLVAGCIDQRMPVLRDRIPTMIDYLCSAMANQQSGKSEPLHDSQLTEIGRSLQDATLRIETERIPASIIHNDLNPGNLLFDGTKVVITDWCEAYLGCPFFTFQHLKMYAEQVAAGSHWGQTLTTTYKRCWSTVLTDRQAETGLALSPPLAVASYLCGKDPSFAAPFRTTGDAQSAARSLARYMHRFTKEHAFREALCH